MKRMKIKGSGYMGRIVKNIM